MYVYIHTLSLAYLLLNCDERTEELLGEIKKIDNVKEVQGTYGRYNAIVKVESDSVKKVKQILNGKIRNIDGIQSSVTLVAPYDDRSNYADEPKPTWEEIRGLSWIFYEK